MIEKIIFRAGRFHSRNDAGDTLRELNEEIRGFLETYTQMDAEAYTKAI